ncbi:SDR family oxidoreductase [Tetragenococcus muriaticus]|uniref:SDR family oxidoreductase n=1 Tax=Tetragenococcus muriaticus TaxID=64642 RepID=UPI0004251570|nr:SDR family oxidoreductase [Tetragenococcus muriaticus]GMA47586.1 oxidoreductase [Tetragenococcus muriaticus]
MSNIKDKVVVIIGASSGIGAATTRKLANEGAKLIIAARREERLKELAEELKESSIIYKVADVTDKEQVQSVVDLAVNTYGRIDVLFNNAGIMPQGNLEAREYDKWQQMLDINIMGVLYGIGAALPYMKEQKDGLIISTDSVAGHVVYPGSAVYNSTKFAVRTIMEGLRQEERENGIRSTIVSPGLVNTELVHTVGDKDLEQNLKSAAEGEGTGLQPEDVANAVVYAVEQPAGVAVSEVLIRPSNQPA